METVKGRSESPFSESKIRNQRPDTPENGDGFPEQVKTKKKRHNKQRLNSKENGNSEKNGNDFHEGEKMSHQPENNEENGSIASDNDCSNGYEVNDTKNQEGKEEEENAALINACVLIEENPTVNESNGNMHEGQISAVCSSTEEPPQISSVTIETESSAKKDIIEEDGLSVEAEANNENNGESCNGEKNDISDSLVESQETAECVSTESASQSGLNGSDPSGHYNDEHTGKDYIQASPDTGVKEDNSFSHKISNFLGKWNYSSSQEEKQDSEISSSKNINESVGSEGPLPNHPYLSKVSGRRGIKERLNASTSFSSSKDEEMKTPTNSGNPLDDSFRVRTNPPRLNSTDLQENPTLRKYKGKRCLNASDEIEDEAGVCLNAIKRQKLDDSHDTGLLGSILWSPFKKKPLETENVMKPTTAESKLSRFLSPFWFWKKTAAGQNRK